MFVYSTQNHLLFFIKIILDHIDDQKGGKLLKFCFHSVSPRIMLMISHTLCDSRYQILNRDELNAKSKKEGMDGIAGTNIHRMRCRLGIRFCI